MLAVLRDMSAFVELLTVLSLLTGHAAAAVSSPTTGCASKMNPSAISCSDTVHSETVTFDAGQMADALSKGLPYTGATPSWCPSLSSVSRQKTDAPGQPGVMFVDVTLSQKKEISPWANEHSVVVTGWYHTDGTYTGFTVCNAIGLKPEVVKDCKCD